MEKKKDPSFELIPTRSLEEELKFLETIKLKIAYSSDTASLRFRFSDFTDPNVSSVTQAYGRLGRAKDVFSRFIKLGILNNYESGEAAMFNTVVSFDVDKQGLVDYEKAVRGEIESRRKVSDEVVMVESMVNKPNLRELLKRAITSLDLPKKQRKLLIALSNFKPVKKGELISKSGTEDSDSLRSLVGEVNGKLSRGEESKSFFIKGLRGKPFSGYQLISQIEN